MNLGIIPGDGGSWFLTRELGYQRAAELTFTGRIVDAAEALALGMVLKVTEPEQLLTEAGALAKVIASKPPRTLRLTKRILKQALRTDIKEFLEICAVTQAVAHHTEDHREAMEAYFEKREPRFTGR